VADGSAASNPLHPSAIIGGEPHVASLDEAPILAFAAASHSGGPAGIDVADDPDYLYISGELDKLDSLEAQESAKARGDDPQPNWFEIELRAQRLLETKTKDMVLACWYAMALFHRYEYAGLSAGLGLINEYVKSWEAIFPERERKKKAQIEALGERFIVGGMSEWFRHKPLQATAPADAFDAVDKAVQRAESIRDAVGAKMPDDKPDLAKFISALKGFAGLRPKAEAPAPAPAPGATASTGAAPATGGGGGEATYTPTAVADVSGAMTAIYGAVKFLREADMANPVPYAVIRAAKWAKASLPPPGEARTTLPPPEAALLTKHAALFQEGKWEPLLKAAEADFRGNDPLWLDLQRYVCAAMTNLGAPFELAKKSVMALTGALVQRLGPGIFELRFKNGTPLCSGETKLWIETECAVSSGRPSGGGGGAAANGKLTEAYEKARGMAGSGKLAEALAELNEGLAACAQRRDRLLWRLRIAQLCADAGKHAVAVPLLEQCQVDIERHHVEEWEPAVAAEVAHALYRCRKALMALEKQPTPESRERLSGAFAWLCRLDPPAALALEPNSN